MRQVDRYRIEAELDSGGFGTVYRARHTVIGRVVALKLLHPAREASLEVVERFLREARILSAIASPHVVQVIDAGMTAERQLFLAMELLEGESLAARIQRAGPMTMRDAIAITRQIGKGLAAAHAVGIVHRDLKPANVFLTRTPDGGELAKVLDFGISKSRGGADDSAITMTGAVLGTPHYMAPEQLHGARDVDGRADLYALSVCLYEMLSGRLPYQATTLEALIAQRLSDPPTPLATHAPHLPSALLALIDRGLARDPDARFRSVAELDAALVALSSTPLPPTTPPQRFVHDAPSVAPRPYGAAAPALAADTPRTPAPRGSSSAPPSIADTQPAPTSGSATLVVLLGGATLAIVLLVGALAMVTTVLVMSREPPVASPSTPPAAPPAAPLQPTPAAPLQPTPAAPLQPTPAAPLQPVATTPPAEVGTSRPSPAPSPTRAWVDRVLGELDHDAMDRLLARAAPRIDRCRRDVPDDVLIQVFVSLDGSLPIVQPDVNEPHGHHETARCVAIALQAAGPLESDRSDGIISVRAHLEPR